MHTPCGTSERATGTSAGFRVGELVPIAVMIAAGCVTCAESMVARALQRGASGRDVERTLRVVADLRQRECLRQAVGDEVVMRMDRPLAAARRVLERAAEKTS